MSNQDITVAVLGASAKEDRYSYKCVSLLLEHGYNVIPITPAKNTICGITPVSAVENIDCDVDVLTMYVNPARSSDMKDAIINLKPTRIIFNPGTESDELEAACEAAGIATERACTLILLNTDQF